MAFVRRQLRVHAAMWLALQVAWLLAVVPRDCCALHKPDQSCHEAASSDYCPMQAADGTPCPMHRRLAHHGELATAGAAGHHHDAAPMTPECRVSSGCEGPMAALFTLLSNTGILPDSTAAAPAASRSTERLAIRETAVGRLESPDAPPPRI
jgi:hypothetical protein